MKVSVLISNWNRARLLDRSLWLLTHQTHEIDEIWVVDCGSVDDSIQVAKRHGVIWEQIKQPFHKREGAIIGWRHAYEQTEADFIILTHPEIMVPTHAIAAMLKEHGETRSSCTTYCLGPKQQELIGSVNWKYDVNTLCDLPGFWMYRNYWGFDNLEAGSHFEAFLFTGQTREQWKTWFPKLGDDGRHDFFTGYEDKIAPMERERGMIAKPMTFSVYHQYHKWQRPGKPPVEDEYQKSVRLRRAQND